MEWAIHAEGFGSYSDIRDYFNWLLESVSPVIRKMLKCLALARVPRTLDLIVKVMSEGRLSADEGLKRASLDPLD